MRLGVYALRMAFWIGRAPGGSFCLILFGLISHGIGCIASEGVSCFFSFLVFGRLILIQKQEF